MHSGFSQKSELHFEMVKSGWDNRPCRSKPLMAKVRTLKKNLHIYIHTYIYVRIYTYLYNVVKK